MSIRRLQTLMAVLAVATAVSSPRAVAAQTVLSRTPNLSGAWEGESGVVHFNFLHRFDLVDSDGNDRGDKITNTPSFFLAVPLPGRTLVGLTYASNSLVAPGEFNEFEVQGRWAPLSAEDGFPADAGVTVAYNTAAGRGSDDGGGGGSLDLELAVTVPLGRLSLLGAGRVLGDAYGSGDTRLAGGGGFVLTLHEGLALAGDVMTLTDRGPEEDMAWGMGVQTRIPFTPHTFSLQATNTRAATLQSSSLGRERNGDNEVLWGFEFTIPFTLARYFGTEEAPDPGAAPGPPAGTTAAEVTMTNQLRYSPRTVRIRAGEAVRWRNTTPLVHTVTADAARARNPEGSVALPPGAQPFDSGDLRPGDVFQHTFTVPGTYVYFCVPHEGAGMVGSVVVEP